MLNCNIWLLLVVLVVAAAQILVLAVLGDIETHFRLKQAVKIAQRKHAFSLSNCQFQ
jgi:hypothetical protein